MKKYDVYLPLKYNDGTEIETQKLRNIERQLTAAFGAITVSPLSAPFKGTWRHGGVEFMDDIIRIEILVEESSDASRFFKRYKQQLKRTLRQFEILITVQNVERV